MGSKGSCPHTKAYNKHLHLHTTSAICKQIWNPTSILLFPAVFWLQGAIFVIHACENMWISELPWKTNPTFLCKVTDTDVRGQAYWFFLLFTHPSHTQAPNEPSPLWKVKNLCSTALTVRFPLEPFYKTVTALCWGSASWQGGPLQPHLAIQDSHSHPTTAAPRNKLPQVYQVDQVCMDRQDSLQRSLQRFVYSLATLSGLF